jgi:hypothetical protein
MKNFTALSLLLPGFLLTILGGCSKDNDNPPENDVIVLQSSGDINPVINEFRKLLGDQLNTAPGAQGGRREINWDGTPDDMLNKKLPLDFFNPTGDDALVANQRGLKYSSAGSFQVSKTNFAEVNATASAQFSSFSGDKVFANISSNLWDVEFEVPGQAVSARVQGFGIVFSDVDESQSTSLEFFDGQKSLGKFFVPAKEGSNFSFLGVYFKKGKVSRVRVAHDSQLDKLENDISDNGPADLVVMDNFLYSEPVK